MTDDLEQDSLEWHQYREGHCNASEAPAVMDCGRFKPRNKRELTMVRNGSLVIVHSDYAKKQIMQPGLDTEKNVLAELDTMRQAGGLAATFAPKVLEYTVDGLPLSASLDGVADDRWVEIKTVTSDKSPYWTYAQKGIIEASVLWQMTHQYLVCREHGITQGCLIVVNGDMRISIPYVHDEAREEALLREWKLVWPYIQNGTSMGERTDPGWMDAARRYLLAKKQVEQAEEELDFIKKELTVLAAGQAYPSVGGGVSVDQVTRSGGLDYSKLDQAILDTLPRKPDTTYATVTVTNKGKKRGK